MIGKTIIGRSFKGCLNYNLSKIEKGQGEILECRGVRDFDRKAMIRDFNFRRMANPDLSRNVWHTALSFQDKLSSSQMLTIAKQWMKGMGLDNTQYVVLRHTDTSHHHVHIVANRINDEGNTIPDNHNWKRSEALCMELVKNHKLTPVPGERNEAKINRDKLRGWDLLKTDINRLIKTVLTECKSFDEFSSKMKESGFVCMIKLNPNGTVRGVSFERDGIKIKASDIHKTLSANHLSEIIELNRLRSLGQTQIREMEKKKLASLKQNKIPTFGKLGKALDTSDDDEKKRNKKGSDFEIGI